MKATKMSAILVLGLVVCSAPIVYGTQYLTVNGQHIHSITLELGQPRTVEVVSTDGTYYAAYVGFDNGVVLGDFSHRQTKPEAGNLAAVAEYNQPAFYGYYVNAAGFSPPPSAGVHFVFEYMALQLGETDVKLYNDTFTSVIDSVHITVIPLQPVAMGTAFTYQGRLMDANQPADGEYDFKFKLYDNPDSVFAAQQGSTIDINDLDVIDGSFTVELDFGSEPNIFNGEARWLEIATRPGDSNDPNAFVTLSPRTELTPTPYAIYAANGGLMSIDGVSNPGSDVDLIPQDSITISPNIIAKVITIGENHSARTDNPHQVTPLQIGALVSTDGVSNPGGNIDFVQQNAITITPDDTAKSIRIGENHSPRTDNPHLVSAAQTGALASVGGVSNPGGNVDFVAGDNITISPNPADNTITFSSGSGIKQIFRGVITFSYYENQKTESFTSYPGIDPTKSMVFLSNVVFSSFTNGDKNQDARNGACLSSLTQTQIGVIVEPVPSEVTMRHVSYQIIEYY